VQLARVAYVDAPLERSGGAASSVGPDACSSRSSCRHRHRPQQRCPGDRVRGIAITPPRPGRTPLAVDSDRRAASAGTPSFWAIAQVRAPRQRVAAGCCIQRWCLQPNKVAASDLAVPAARALRVRGPPRVACTPHTKRRSLRSVPAGIGAVRVGSRSARVVPFRNDRRIWRSCDFRRRCS
jgi:hypothetical protein